MHSSARLGGQPVKTIASALLSAAAILTVSGAQAAGYAPGYGGRFVLVCENGANYPFLPRAVSVVGEVVTGYIGVGRRPVHVRLVPMGDGYRYAGYNIWLDGKDDVAILYFGKTSAVKCTVTRDASDVAVISVKN